MKKLQSILIPKKASMKNSARLCRLVVICSLLMSCAGYLQAQTPITLYNSFSGLVNYTVIGGSLRTSSNVVNACAVGTSSSYTLAVPTNDTIVGAYLYWAGSGTTSDYTVNLDAQVVTASPLYQFTAPNPANGNMMFSGFADVTTYVLGKGNGSYTFSGLTVNTGNPWCSSQNVCAGWGMVVVYKGASELRHTINIYQGFEAFYGSEIIFNPNNFYVPYSHVDGKLTHITWEGDLENSAPLGPFYENLGFDGQILSDTLNPVNNQFNSVSNALTPDTTWGVDIDTYDVTRYLHSGDTVATSVYSSGGDAVWLSCEVISVSDTSNSDMSITKSHTVLSGAYSGGIIAGNQIKYTLTAVNNGPDTTGAVTVRDSLPRGAQFISFTGSGWTVDSTAKPVYKFTHAGNHLPNAAIPSIAITAYVTANYMTSTAGETMYNTATVSSPQFDRRPWNNTATDSVTVYTPLFLTSTKTCVNVNAGKTYPAAGDTMKYTLTIQNVGNYTAKSVSVIDTVPTAFTLLAGSITPASPGGTIGNGGHTLTFNSIDSIIVNAIDTLTYKVILGATFIPSDSQYTNIAHVQAGTVNQKLSVAVVPSPNLSISKYYDAGKSKYGDTATYHIVVKNLSALISSVSTVVYDTAYGYRFVSASGSANAGSVAYAAKAGTGGIFTWTLPTPLAAGVSDTMTFKVIDTSNTSTMRDTAWVVNAQRFRTSSVTSQYISANHTGKITGPSSILPADTLYYTLADEDLNTSATTVQTLKCIVIDSVTAKSAHERDSVTFTETGVNTGIFTGKIISKYSTTAGINFNNVTMNVQPNDSIMILYTDALDSLGIANQVRVWKTVVKAGNTGTLTGTSTIYPGNSISYTLSDADLNKNPLAVEQYVLADTNKVTGEAENITFTETGVNTGVFTGSIPTVYGTTAGSNNNGTFNVKNGDSLRITYFDAVTTSGLSATISWTTKVLGGYTAALAATAQIYPQNSIQVVVTDKDLNKNSSAVESYTVRDSDKVTNQYQDITITERSANDSVFIGYVSTRYGVITGANNIGYIYVQQGDSLRVSYMDTMQTNGSAGSLLTAMTHVLGGHPATLTVNKSSMYPGDSVLIAVSDTDLNRSASFIESYSVIDSNIVTKEWETITVTETGVNTGVFQGYAHTKFGLTAGANNNGIFNVKTGDSLVVTYIDTVTTNGAPGLTLKAGTGVRGGTTATLSGTLLILPGTTILDTLKDADLNKNAALAETYMLRDTSKNGQIDTVTFTETGVSTGIFTASIPTTFGVTKGTNGKNVTFKAQAGDTIMLAYYDTLQSNGGSAWLYAMTVVTGGNTAVLKVSPSILPGASAIDTLTDNDLNKNALAAETFSLRDTSRNGQIDTVTFTETGLNTGVFTASVPTVFGTTKGSNGKNVTFNAQAGDTLYLFYTDTLASNGGPGAAMVGKTAIIGGSTAQLKGSISIVPGLSVLDTVVDQDLNKNAALAETYTLRDTSSNGQVDTVTFTETGANTGIFAAAIPTAYGKTKGTSGKNVTFNANGGDTLCLVYKDTVAANGGPGATLQLKCGVINPQMTVTKAVDKSHGKPGDTLTYTMTYKNTGTANAMFVTVTDPSPNNTTYVANSVTLNGVAQTDASDGDATTYSGGMLQINVGTVTPGQSGTIIFKVVIQ